MLDPLSDILTRLTLNGTLYFRTAFTPPWGIAVPAYENVARFHFAHRGDCRVRICSTDTTVTVAQGDLIIIPHGAAHDLICGRHPHSAVLPLDTVLERSGYNGRGVLVYGGDADDHETQLICGHFSLAPRASHMLFDQLPDYILIRNYGEHAGRWMDTSLRLIADEVGQDRFGGDLIAQKISEILFVQALRTFIETDAAARVGLAGFADPHISRALAAFHRDPGITWTVEGLARAAGQSRTGFAMHFSRTMGLAPMEYVTRWRIQIAQQDLIARTKPITDIARDVGYASDSAFARVFKRETGQSPAAFRNDHSPTRALEHTSF
ncbi:AraC family transcriptional regulator [uncultured Tateyamaria sp.]|uniref:AraC family transcriptional regulator n=1 Tax=uncultured Tateyamaria sp. TaxID=455651 RepID=UPI0026027704|nr:AraC family transcriptional regulator [uncultured Tateyamaria sp.]